MDTNERIDRMEERLTWLQKHAVEQDKIISAQNFEIELLKKKLTLLVSKSTERDTERNDEGMDRPPHY